MEITVTLHHAALEAEFEGQDRDEIQSEVLDFINFIDENSEDLDVLDPGVVTNEVSDPGSIQASVTNDEEVDDSTSQTTFGPVGRDCFETIARRARVDEVF